MQIPATEAAIPSLSCSSAFHFPCTPDYDERARRGALRLPARRVDSPHRRRLVGKYLVRDGDRIHRPAFVLDRALKNCGQTRGRRCRGNTPDSRERPGNSRRQSRITEATSVFVVALSPLRFPLSMGNRKKNAHKFPPSNR